MPQLSLLKPPPVVPLPHGGEHYVPVLQNRGGERTALERAATETWERMTPLIALVDDKKGPSQPVNHATARSWLKDLALPLGDHLFFLDLLRLSASRPVETKKQGKVPLLEAVYAAARKRDLNFIPVAPVGYGDISHLSLVADAVAEDRRGAALRYRPNESVLPTGKTHASVLSAALQSLCLDAPDADLLVDLAYIDPDAVVDPNHLASELRAMLSVGRWRSVVLLGSSIPSALTCVEEGEVGTITRQEWNLWRSLASIPLGRVVSYGDYAIQHPLPPGKGGPGMRANVRYTEGSETVIARGYAVMQEGSAQYADLCLKLRSRSGFESTYTWGDEVIDLCSRRRHRTGGQTLWRGVGTSHHLRTVVEQLQGLR